jgi:hypothetical protein
LQSLPLAIVQQSPQLPETSRRFGLETIHSRPHCLSLIMRIDKMAAQEL